MSSKPVNKIQKSIGKEKMEWYGLFRQHILERGAEYHQDGYVSAFSITEQGIEAKVEGTEIYHVNIEIDGERVVHMSCDCPYAESGNNYKHMAAVLFRFEEYLYEEDVTKEETVEKENRELSLQEIYAEKREKAVELVNKIPEEKVREILVKYVLNDDSLKNRLELEYLNHLNAKQMSALKNEINDIVYSNSHRGFVDWYHASDFTSGLSCFLKSKVKILIEKNYLKQAFELTNIVFYWIGNIDMDDSGGDSIYVANECYECWDLILQKCDIRQKEKMKKWFESHQSGYVIDFMEEYLQEFLFSKFLSETLIEEKIEELDEIISKCSGKNDCGSIYSVHYGYENVIVKRMEYMKMLGCTEREIMEFREQNRQFFVIREMKIKEALEKQDYEVAKQLLLESKGLDAGYPEQVGRYSEQLIALYDKNGERENYRRELLYQLENYHHTDLKYFLALKEIITKGEEWESTVNQIISSNKNLYFVCQILNQEKRYKELMKAIEKSNSIDLLDKYGKNLKKVLPGAVIEMYRKYILEEVQRVSDRNGYRQLMKYLKKISNIPNGKDVALQIAEQWKVEYRRRSAMMDELRKIGFFE